MSDFSSSAIPLSHFRKLATDLTEGLLILRGGSERESAAKSLQGACYYLHTTPYFAGSGQAMLPILAGIELLDDGARPEIFRLRKSTKQLASVPNSDSSLDIEEKLLNTLLKSDKEAGRLGGIIAIRAVIDYIESHTDLDNDLAIPLKRLVDALEHLDQGIVDVLLVPKIVKGAPKHDTYPDIIKATAIAIVDALIKAGDPLPVALNRVTRELKALGHPMGGHRDTPDAKILQRWREGMSRLKEHSILLSVYKAISTELENSAYPSPEAAWDDLKLVLARMTRNSQLRLGSGN